MKKIDVSKGRSYKRYRWKKQASKGNLNKKKKFERFRWRLLIIYLEGYDEEYYDGCRLRSMAHGICIVQRLERSSTQRAQIHKNHYWL